MIKPEIHTGPEKIKDTEYHYTCNACGNNNYPTATWDIQWDNAYYGLCIDCLEEAVFQCHHPPEEKRDD